MYIVAGISILSSYKLRPVILNFKMLKWDIFDYNKLLSTTYRYYIIFNAIILHIMIMCH